MNQKLKITPGPWEYRPHEFDDWGVVKAEKFTICQARDPRYMNEDILSQHRKAGTDPWEANARAIASLPALIEAAEPIAVAYDEPNCRRMSGVHDVVVLPAYYVAALRSALSKINGGGNG